MPCNLGATPPFGRDRDIDIIQGRTGSEGDIWFMSTNSDPGRYPALLCRMVGKLQAKGVTVELERVRLLIYLLQSLRGVPFGARFRMKANRLHSSEFDQAMQIGIDWGHIRLAGDPGLIAGGSSGGLRNALMTMGG